jgi:hypothetical protein
MNPSKLIAIRERAAAVSTDLRATAHSYGAPCVMIPCQSARQAEAVAIFVRAARADIAALLAEVGEPIEPAQAVMELL